MLGVFVVRKIEKEYFIIQKTRKFEIGTAEILKISAFMPCLKGHDDRIDIDKYPEKQKVQDRICKHQYNEQAPLILFIPYLFDL